MAGQLYNVFLGGDKFKYPWDNLADNDLSDQRLHQEYAAHLKRTHFTVPFYFARFAPYWNSWFNESGLTDLDVGDTLGTHLLAAGSYLERLVFNNKKAVPGTRLEIRVLGTHGNTPANFAALQTAVDTTKATYNEKLIAFNADNTNETKRTEKDEAKAAYDAAEQALQEASNVEILKKEIQLDVPGFTLVKLDKLLQSNGRVEVKLLAGSMTNVCFHLGVEVNHFNDEHGCPCGVLPCETEYPDALCVPEYPTKMLG